MPLFRINNNTSGFIQKEKLLENVLCASSFFEKLTGLIFKKGLNDNTCLVIQNCNSIHTFGMHFRIDLIFLDCDGNIVKIYDNMRPFRFTPLIKKAKNTIECPPGFIKSKKIKIGETLLFQHF